MPMHVREQLHFGPNRRQGRRPKHKTTGENTSYLLPTETALVAAGSGPASVLSRDSGKTLVAAGPSGAGKGTEPAGAGAKPAGEGTMAARDSGTAGASEMPSASAGMAEVPTLETPPAST